MSVTSTGVHFDLYDRELYADPYPMYRRLRDEQPLHRDEEHGYYVVSRFDDVAAVLGDRDTYCSGKGSVYQIAAAGVAMPDGLFISEDPPRHTVHRALVSRLFTPRAIGHLEPQIRELFDAAARAVAERDRFDFVQDFANMLPIQVIGMLLGLPANDHAALRDAFHRAQNEGTTDTERDAFAGIAEAAVWFTEYLDHRAAHPTDDLMSQLLRTQFEDEHGETRLLRRDELLTFLVLITGAGSDTTVNAIGWIGKLLGEHPEHLARLRAEPDLVPVAVEEVLRYEAIPYHIARTTTRDVELHGTVVPAGSIVLALPGAANRDERHHTDPDRFDITRKPGQIFSFSFGPHFCLGASLARLEARIALEVALEHIGSWRFEVDGAALTTGIDTRGYDRVPVVVRP